MRGETYDEVLEQGLAMLEVDVRASRQMYGLLEEDGIWAGNFAHIYRDFLGFKLEKVLRRRRRGWYSPASVQKKSSS